MWVCVGVRAHSHMHVATCSSRIRAYALSVGQGRSVSEERGVVGRRERGVQVSQPSNKRMSATSSSSSHHCTNPPLVKFSLSSLQTLPSTLNGYKKSSAHKLKLTPVIAFNIFGFIH